MKNTDPMTRVSVSQVEILPGEVLTLWVSNQCGERTQIEVRSVWDKVTGSSPTRPHVGHPQVFVDSTDDYPVEVKPFSEWTSLEQEGVRCGGHYYGSERKEG